MKYCMLAINRRYDDDNTVLIRRILIEYHGYTNITDNLIMPAAAKTYTGTRIIDKDPYFYAEDSSHKYHFEDGGYKLLSNQYNGELSEFRQYHAYCWLPAIEFEAKSDEEAIYQFRNREEKH